MSVFEVFPLLYLGLVALFGLIIGSFLNVVIYRLPLMLNHAWQHNCAQKPDEVTSLPQTRPLSLSLPRSHCPHCQHPIRVRDNIPLLSWCLLKGRCRDCQTPIAWRYPAIELLSMLASVVVAITLAPSWYALCVLAVTYALIALTFIDVDHMLLPDQITLPLVWAGLLAALLNISPVSLEQSVIGAMLGYLSLWSIYWGFKLITGKEGLGYGDFKLFAAAGAWLGWQLLPQTIFLAAVVGIIGGLISLNNKQQQLNQAFPFGPYIAAAFWLMLLWGNDLTQAYLDFVTS
ncbi:MAG: prepilin peptidase [Vibrio sp.]